MSNTTSETFFAPAKSTLEYLNSICTLEHRPNEGVFRINDGKRITSGSKFSGWVRFLNGEGNATSFVHMANSYMHSVVGPASIRIEWVDTAADRLCLVFSWYRKSKQVNKEEIHNTKTKQDRYECLVAILTSL
jgi:hypothetical protein